MKIAIGNSDYTLKKANKKTLQKYGTEEFEIFGSCDFKNEEILIDKELPPSFAKKVFWHEMIHAMLEDIGECELCVDEHFVEALSKQIYGFLNRNNLNKIYSFISGEK